MRCFPAPKDVPQGPSEQTICAALLADRPTHPFTAVDVPIASRKQYGRLRTSRTPAHVFERNLRQDGTKLHESQTNYQGVL